MIIIRAADWLAASLVLLLIFLFGGRFADLTGRQIPLLYYGALHGDLMDRYPGVLTIAHNTGDTPAAARLALAYKADIIEIDVIYANGELYAAHNGPGPALGSQVYRAPRLSAVWNAASGADLVQLDLKSSSPGYLAKVFAFVDNHRDKPIILSSRSPAVLQAALADRVPALRMLSIATSGELRALKEDPDALAALDGVTMSAHLASEETVSWLKERDLAVFVWVVNKLPVVNEVVGYGVDGIVTDNLAVMELLGDDKEAEDFFPRAKRRF